MTFELSPSGDEFPRNVLIDAPARLLPASLRARLVPGSIIAPTDGFRPVAPRSILSPMVWILVFTALGLLALMGTISRGFDPESGAQRFIYAGLAGVFLLAAAYSARSLVHAWSHRGDSSRLGCHVVAREGLLIAERGRCTWIPRGWLPAPVDDPSTDTRFGAGGALFVISDGQGNIKRWTVPRRIGSELDLWRREGVMPQWSP